jgi:hypothetical protein
MGVLGGVRIPKRSAVKVLTGGLFNNWTGDGDEVMFSG